MLGIRSESPPKNNELKIFRKTQIKKPSQLSYETASFYFMDYYVYIIQSEVSGIFYKGYTTNPELRLLEHNSDQSRYTAGKGPWKIVYLEKMMDKRSALVSGRTGQSRKYHGMILRSTDLIHY